MKTGKLNKVILCKKNPNRCRQQYNQLAHYYQGYKRSGTTMQAMFMSALLFALMHMNFNQAAYAFVIGVLVVLLIEATGSIWSSIIVHIVINSQQVLMLYVLEDGLMDATVLSTNSMEIAFTRVTRGMIKKVKRITINTVDIFIL